MPDQYLAIADADRIHEYVFTPHELKLIRGGSAVQSQLNTDELVKLVPGPADNVISANGGTVLAKFGNRGLAEEFCCKAAETFRERTDIATVTTAYTEYPPGEFRQAWLKVRGLLELQKQTRSAPLANGGGPYWKSCEACGEHPAEKRAQDRLICPACWIHRENAERVEKDQRGYAFAGEFEQLGALADPENYLAVVYIDLDRLGEYLNKHIWTEEDCRILSKAIDGSVCDAADEACAALPIPDSEEEYLLYVPLLQGGDDAIIAFAADAAIPFLEEFGQWYPRKFKEILDKERFSRTIDPPPFSAGVAIAHSHFPISEFVRIAEDLLVLAKRRKDENAVDFAVLTASMVEGTGRGPQSKRGDGYYRTRQPYSLAEFKGLCDNIRELKKAVVPSSQIKSLYRTTYEYWVQAEFEYLNLLSRLSEAHRALLLQAVGQRLFELQNDGRWTTRAADLVELWEFVHAD
jgi:hypothetical protein